MVFIGEVGRVLFEEVTSPELRRGIKREWEAGKGLVRNILGRENSMCSAMRLG